MKYVGLKNKLLIGCLSCMIILSISACSQNEGNESNKKSVEKQEPVELTIYSHKLKMGDDTFKKLVADPINKAYPYITLKWLYYDGSKNMPDLQELWSQGVKPDIIFASQYYAIEFSSKLNSIIDLRDLIKKHNVDINKFEPANMDAIKKYSDKGEIYALPYSSNFFGLWYNKDIFDKFGVAYPKDGLDWDEAIELAKTVTRNEAGIQYHGIGSNGGDKVLSQLSLPYVDPKTHEVLIGTPEWGKALTLFKKLFDIPGNFNEEMHKSYSNSVEIFRNDKTMAMLPYHNLIERLVESEQKNALKWDVATYPVFPGYPKVYGEVEADSFMIVSNTDHQDDAFKVIDFLTSDEMQLTMAKSFRMSSLKDQKFKNAYGADLPELKTKNIEGIFKIGPAPMHATSIFEEDGTSSARNAYKDSMSGAKDINTALRDVKEKLEKKIKEQISQ